MFELLCCFGGQGRHQLTRVDTARRSNIVQSNKLALVGARARENMQAELYKVDGSNRLDASLFDADENASARAAALGAHSVFTS